jgi:molecular chaperone DnaK (HSP70)
MKRMTEPLERLLARIDKLNGVALADVKAVELFGGASRFGALQTQLSVVAGQFGLSIGHRLNTELSAAQVSFAYDCRFL